MKKNTNNSNNKNVSARRKLIPAVAMLATSAAMLSTSTYAWFTMSKEVEVTGLSMSATAGDSLEISLGKLDGSSTPSIDAPSYNDSSWKSAIAIDEYYASVGKLKPASSADGLTIYSVDSKDAYAGGTKVKASADVSAKNKGDSATLKLDSETNTPFTVSPESDDEGFYIDVPMWIRTSKAQDTPVYCTVNISDKNGGSAKGDLKKAVRVAIVPIDQATAGADGSNDNIVSLSLPGSANYTNSSDESATLAADSDGSSVLFGLDQDTYKVRVLGNSTTYSSALVPAPTINTGATSSDQYNPGVSENKLVFTIPAASAGQYSGVGFVARIWLEGESTFCNDANAAQDWNIDFHFTLDSVPAPTGP